MSLALYLSRVRSSELLGGRDEVLTSVRPRICRFPFNARVGGLEHTRGDTEQPSCVFVGSKCMNNVARNSMLYLIDRIQLFEAKFHRF